MKKIYRLINFNIDHSGQNEHPIWHLEYVKLNHIYNKYHHDWFPLWSWHL